MQISPCCLVLKLEIQKNIFPWTRQQGLICTVNKRILKWRPFWNKVYGVSTWKLSCFRSILRGEIWKRNNQHFFWVCVWKKLGQQNYMITVKLSFSKSTIFKMIFIQTKREAGVFKFMQFEERCRKAPFSWRFILDSKRRCRNKAGFSNFSSKWRRDVVLNVEGLNIYPLMRDEYWKSIVHT